jgi:xylulokinase
MPLMGIDVGTSGTKALILGDDGRLLAHASAPTPLLTPKPLWTEQDPEHWWAAVGQASRLALANATLRPTDIRAVGLSGQMHGSVFLDRQGLDGGPALRPALLWNDQRTADFLEPIEHAAGGRAELVRRTGNAALTGFQLPKILWLRQHEPHLFRRLAAVLLPKDFIRLRMTGVPATDVGDAGGTLALDVHHRRWDTALLRALDLEPALFPPLLESAQIAGQLTAPAAQHLGLAPGTPVAAGSGDNQCGAVGAGIVEPGLALCILGTSGVIFAHAQAPTPDLPTGRTHTMPSATGSASSSGAWCVTGVMLSAAGSLQWAHERLFPDIPLERLLAEAWSSTPGCEGLLFLPYLQGERCPHQDPHARGAFVGLSLRHSRAHLVRAVIEGVSFALADILRLVTSLGVPVRALRLSGGGAKSPQWRQLLADLTQLPVEVPSTPEGGSFGAAILAGVAAEVWPNVPAACRSLVAATDRADPNPAAAAELNPYREQFRAAYSDLRSRFHAIAGLHA